MTYYEILNIKQTASDKEIKNAYRSLAKKYHPDTYKGNKNVAEEKMKIINEAYDVLSNKELKSKYDEQFKVTQTSAIQNEYDSKSYYNYETYEYRSPDPPEADYRNYYNYSVDYEYEPEYDFSKLKILFTGSKLKIIFLIIGIVSVLCFLFYMFNQIRLKALAILEPIQQVEVQPVENVPIDSYNKKSNDIVINTEQIQNNIKKYEEDFNVWYENEGKQYEKEIKQGLESFYKELLNYANN